MRLFKVLPLIFVLTLASLIVLPEVSAHVVVKPAEVGVAVYQTFDVSVPNEKDANVTALRLLIPKGVESVSPTVKTGWNVDVVKNGDQVTEINWTGGIIPAGQRDDFTFSAKTPGSQATLGWKAYQTYDDGTIVSWDANPSAMHGNDEGEDKGPYSTTKVINDLVPTEFKEPAQNTTKKQDVLVWTALALSVVSIGMQLTRKK